MPVFHALFDLSLSRVLPIFHIFLTYSSISLCSSTFFIVLVGNGALHNGLASFDVGFHTQILSSACDQIPWDVSFGLCFYLRDGCFSFPNFSLQHLLAYIIPNYCFPFPFVLYLAILSTLARWQPDFYGNLVICHPFIRKADDSSTPHK